MWYQSNKTDKLSEIQKKYWKLTQNYRTTRPPHKNWQEYTYAMHGKEIS